MVKRSILILPMFGVTQRTSTAYFKAQIGFNIEKEIDLLMEGEIRMTRWV
jgi:hypothetical protein